LFRDKFLKTMNQFSLYNNMFVPHLILEKIEEATVVQSVNTFYLMKDKTSLEKNYF
jgi:hypothetical protein